MVDSVRASERARPPVKARPAAKPKPWLVGFVLLHLSCQLLLIMPGISSVRVFVRVAAFGLSLAFLVLIPSMPARGALRSCALCIMLLFALEFFHPEGSGLLAALASIMLNLAVLGPIFWVPRTRPSISVLQRVITLLWLYYTASAVVGVLQAYFPGSFQTQLSAVYAGMRKANLVGLQIELASGASIFRPMGLTDSPGGAASAGMYAVLLGTGMILSPKRQFFGGRIAALVSVLAGMICLYLCEIRSLVVMTGVCVITLFLLLLISGRISRLLGMFALLGAAIPSAFAMAFTLGGDSMLERLNTLVQADPGTVYYANRGHFLEVTLYRYLPLYPLGAGLGRWGMVHSYFGNASDSLWAEIQWTAWLFDGGLALIVLYLSAILIASWVCFQIARGRLGGGDPVLTLWGAVLVAYNVGALAVCFNYPLFAGTSGVEFWLLNSVVIAAAHTADREAARNKLAYSST